jgi:adenylosuccinate synthase
MLKVVTGGQFGSEAKGAVTAALCNEAVKDGHDVHVVRVGGPNAGHTAYDPDGQKWALRQVPAGMVVHSDVQGYIADGSEIDLVVLTDELDRLEAAGHKVRDRLTVSGEATVIGQEHKRREQALVGQIGSTGKGIGAARADRLLRTAHRVSDFAGRGALPDLGVRIEEANRIGPGLTMLARDRYSSVVVEGVQGYGLGLHAGFYPQCTSSDVRAIDSLAAAGISPWGLMPDLDLELHLVVRPYPIRVAGNSGPLRGETSWEELGLEPERTTVTQKIRRVGEFDLDLVREAIQANGPGVLLAVSMMDQLGGATYEAGELNGRACRGLTRDGVAWLHQLEAATGQSVRWYGTGPTLHDWRIFA